jgi:hypothetical protein
MLTKGKQKQQQAPAKNGSLFFLMAYFFDDEVGSTIFLVLTI